MMNKVVIHCIFLTFVGLIFIFFSFCGTVYAQNNSENIIGIVKGKVKIKRAGWDSYVLASSGMLVNNGDLLQLSPGAIAKIVCANATLQTIKTKSYRVRCGRQKAKTHFKGNRLSRIRSGDYVNEFPVLIAPRMTKLINNYPTIRWSLVKGITKYRISIVSEGIEHWSQEVNEISEIRYPKDAPALKSGIVYKVVISAGDRNSSEERLPNLGFSILSQAEVRLLNTAISKIQALNLPESTTQYLIANLYAYWGDLNNSESDVWPLRYEAINILENLSQNDIHPASRQMLGSLYLTIGLITMAEDNYKKSLKLFEAAENIIGKAQSHYALGQISTVRLNRKEAILQFQTAKELYKTVGDKKMINQIQNEIYELEK